MKSKYNIRQLKGNNIGVRFLSAVNFCVHKVLPSEAKLAFQVLILSLFKAQAFHGWEGTNWYHLDSLVLLPNIYTERSILSTAVITDDIHNTQTVSI